MAREYKSLRFNLDDGKDIPHHREHRSKKGRNCRNFATSPAYFEYKRRKWEQKYEKDDENLQIF